jgi:predicted nuclease with TOPRIM domain
VNLDEVKELRQELEAIEATMERIKELWEELPDPNGLADLKEEAQRTWADLSVIKEVWEELPAAEDLVELREAAESVLVMV